MKIEFYFDVMQVIGETWIVEVSNDTDLLGFIDCVKKNPNIIFEMSHDSQVGDAELSDSETYDTVSMELKTAKVIK